MNRVYAVFLAIVVSVLWAVPFASAREVSPPGISGPHARLAKGNNEFAVKLYRELGSREGNVFFSPYSVSSALGMTYAGARERTAKEIREALSFQFDSPELNAAFKSMNIQLRNTAAKNGQKLNIANGLCITGGSPSKEYKAILREYYEAEIFSGGLEKINGWVKIKTEGKIEKILEKLSPNSMFVLLNAVYFKGIWANKFEKSVTRDAAFTLSPGKKVTVPFMYQEKDFKILTESDFQALSLPYKGNDLSMVILLPKAADGLASLERRLTDSNIKAWLARLDAEQPDNVELYLPRFSFGTDYDLVPATMKLGMVDAFGSSADFTGMGFKVGDLWIAQIKHKAFIEVNEEGTEAAAATAVEMETKGMRYSTVFRADHPFVFLIRDHRTGTILFMGRMADPKG
ncbi:MAG TPA: serpin family protein [Deltaproteobacteria bacterium]|nr:serpin family protein [Deltaproteobacteria bacterium]